MIFISYISKCVSVVAQATSNLGSRKRRRIERGLRANEEPVFFHFYDETCRLSVSPLSPSIAFYWWECMREPLLKLLLPVRIGTRVITKRYKLEIGFLESKSSTVSLRQRFSARRPNHCGTGGSLDDCRTIKSRKLAISRPVFLRNDVPRITAQWISRPAGSELSDLHFP